MLIANREYKFERTDLKDKVVANLAKHKAAYEEATEDYEAAVRAWVGELAKIAAERVPTPSELLCPVQEPESHAAEYETAIELFGMVAEAKVTINTSEFDMFVMDRWNWQQRFQAQMFSNKQVLGGYAD